MHSGKARCAAVMEAVVQRMKYQRLLLICQRHQMIVEGDNAVLSNSTDADAKVASVESPC